MTFQESGRNGLLRDTRDRTGAALWAYVKASLTSLVKRARQRERERERERDRVIGRASCRERV